MAFLGGIFDDTPLGAVIGTGSPIHGIFDPDSWWDRFKNGETNEVNKGIADDNLEYQRERNEIEDARYEEETAYNRAFQEDERDYQRAFAEDERTYNRALQERLFNREDTAQIRQAEQLSALGINPISQQLNGAGAGQVVGSSGAGSPVGNPTLSSRGGSYLHNDFQMQDQGMLPILSSMLSVADTLNGVKTGQYQRDALALQNDKQFLENLRIANNLGIYYDGYMWKKGGHYTNTRKSFGNINPDGSFSDLFDSPQMAQSRYSAFRKDRMNSMPNWQYTLDSFGQDDVYNQVENALTKGSQLFDKVYDNFDDKKNYKLNPFQTLLNLFF